MSRLTQILKDSNFTFKQQLGQNFISDTNLLNSIVSDSGICKDCVVLEIGAGAGTLTCALSAVAKRVIAYEIDVRLKPVIESVLNGINNAEVIYKDIMDVSDEELIGITGESFHIVSNLPYYITSPVIMRFIESDLNVLSITAMMQREVAERLAAKPNTPEYGAITAAVQLVSDVKITRIVNRRLFYPVPNVDSAVVKMDIRRDKYNVMNMPLVKKVIRSAFSMRRKTLVNNLMAGLNISRELCEEALIRCNLNIKVRGEALSIDNFVELERVIGEFL